MLAVKEWTSCGHTWHRTITHDVYFFDRCFATAACTATKLQWWSDLNPESLCSVRLWMLNFSYTGTKYSDLNWKSNHSDLASEPEGPDSGHILRLSVHITGVMSTKQQYSIHVYVIFWKRSQLHVEMVILTRSRLTTRKQANLQNVKYTYQIFCRHELPQSTSGDMSTAISSVSTVSAHLYMLLCYYA